MRILLLCAALLLAVPSAGIADDTTSGATDTSTAVTDSGSASQSGAVCVQGFQMATCGDFTGCASPTWQCCPNSSNGGWQWADNSSACPI
jgi:hypothetical protein